MTTWSKADSTTQWYDDDWGWNIIKPNVGVIHTTEGLSWPTYPDDATGKPGAKAPHITGKPDFANKVMRWRQHFANEHSSRALQNVAGGVETNTNNALQVELIGTCDDRLRTQWVVNGKTLKAGVDYIYWPAAPDWALEGVAELFAYWSKTYPALPLKSTVTWTKYPYGANVRLSGTQFQNYYGYLGHQHVPENSHDDPGLFPIQKVLTMANEINNPTPTQPAPTTCSLRSNFSNVGQGGEVTLTASVNPAVDGSFYFIWQKPDGNWSAVASAPAVNGSAVVRNTPWNTVRYGVTFQPKDTTKFAASKAPSIVVDVINVGALEERIAKLEGN